MQLPVAEIILIGPGPVIRKSVPSAVSELHCTGWSMMIRMEVGVQANNGILNIMAGGDGGILKFTLAPAVTCL